jgi:hypothetical protein
LPALRVPRVHVRNRDPLRCVGALVIPCKSCTRAREAARGRGADRLPPLCDACAKVAPRPDYHTKAAKLVRATAEQWAAWQREADRLTAGNLNAFMVEAAESRAASAKTMRLRNRHKAPK